MHPFREIMIVLPIPVPFQIFVKRDGGPTLLQLFAYPQSPSGRVLPSLFLIEAADPAGPRVVSAVAAEDVVDLIDELQCQILEFLVPSLLIKAEKVADRKRVRP
jgi:hypothetical protein